MFYQKASQYAVEYFDGFGLTILGAFAKFRKATSSFVMSVRPSTSPPARPPARMQQLSFHRKGFHEIWCFNIIRKYVKKVHLSINLTRITGTLSEHLLCTFVIISRWILLRMRNVSDKSWRENQNTHFVFSKLFLLKIVPFLRQCRKILYS